MVLSFLWFAGYLPQNLYSLNSSYGSEHLLKALLQKMKQYKVRPMADIVINHRVGTTTGHGGRYNRYDGIPLSWDERAVTCCTGGLVRGVVAVELISLLPNGNSDVTDVIVLVCVQVAL